MWGCRESTLIKCKGYKLQWFYFKGGSPENEPLKEDENTSLQTHDDDELVSSAIVVVDQTVVEDDTKKCDNSELLNVVEPTTVAKNYGAGDGKIHENGQNIQSDSSEKCAEKLDESNFMAEESKMASQANETKVIADSSVIGLLGNYNSGSQPITLGNNI